MASVNPVAQRAAAVPGWIRALLLVGSVVLTLYWSFTYSGPYRTLAEWQLEASGGYEVVLTGVFVALLVLLPAAVVVQLLAFYFLRRDTPWDAGARAARMAESEGRILSHLGYIIASVFYLGFGGTSLYFLQSALRAGDLSHVTAASLEAGQRPPSQFVVLEGRLRPEQAPASETQTNSSTIEEVYVPLVSPGWRTGEPVVVYLGTYASWLERYRAELASGSFEGILREDGLPGHLVSELSRTRQLPKGPVWVLDYRASPAQELTTAGTFGFCAGFVAVLASAIAWLRSRRVRA